MLKQPQRICFLGGKEGERGNGKGGLYLKKGIFFLFFGRCWEVGIEKETRYKKNCTILLLAYRCEESRCSSFWQGGMIPLVGVTLYFFLSLALDCTLYCNHNVEERLVSVREARLSPPSMI